MNRNAGQVLELLLVTSEPLRQLRRLDTEQASVLVAVGRHLVTQPSGLGHQGWGAAGRRAEEEERGPHVVLAQQIEHLPHVPFDLRGLVPFGPEDVRYVEALGVRLNEALHIE